MTPPRAVAFCILLVTGCSQHYIDSADSIANRVIHERQQQALGTSTDFDVGPEDGRLGPASDIYAFVPNPIDSEVPAAFRTPAQIPQSLTDTDDWATAMTTNGDVQDVTAPTGRPFTLSEGLNYAFRHSREFQSQKEALYLAALALMTERQLWTPQLESQISLEYANYGQVRDFDQAMTSVAEVSATQRLPYGGEVAASIIHTLMRDIGRHATSGESGTAILEANIPLLKGAGRVAYESRYQAERDLIYAIRDFERSRRDLVVDVAGEFFALLATKAEIDSASAARTNARIDLQRSQAYVAVDRVLQLEADRARVQYLRVSNDLIGARTRYETALDRFKIGIGMPTVEAIDAVDEQMNLYEPEVDADQAMKTAVKYRLDLINLRDAIDDSRRDVLIARNNFLPQFDLAGRVSMNSDPDRLDSFSYNTERTLWQAFLELEVPLDRREERNAYRASLIGLRRAERLYEEARDQVRVDVRTGLRNLELARTSMEIQQENVRINETREKLARAHFERGKLSSNRDVIEAQEELQAARNRFADALAGYRLSILTLLRDCGTLRVDDEGHWLR